jgi:hypothetical protein
VALGRYVRRDIQEFTNSYAQTVKLQGKAVREAARGLYNTPAQADAARFMDETLGKYSRFGPRLRALIQTATPFLPWYLNAARFVFWTLPAKHPFKTAVLLAAEHAFSKDIADQHKDLPPGELKSAVPSGGGFLDLARFTPFGAFTAAAGGDYSQLFSPFFPQFQGVSEGVRRARPVQPPAGGAEDTRQPEGQRDRLRHPQGDGEPSARGVRARPLARSADRGGRQHAVQHVVAGLRHQDQARHGARLLRPRPPARPGAPGVPAPAPTTGHPPRSTTATPSSAVSTADPHRCQQPTTPTLSSARLRERADVPYPQLLLLLRKPLVVEAGCPHG